MEPLTTLNKQELVKYRNLIQEFYDIHIFMVFVKITCTWKVTIFQAAKDEQFRKVFGIDVDGNCIYEEVLQRVINLCISMEMKFQ